MKGFLVTAPDARIYGDELVDFVCKIFGNYAQRYEAARGWLLGEGFYSRRHSRIGVMDGKIVTHWGIFDYPMRVGGALLRTGGVGSVGTHAQYRRRGLMELTAADSLRDLRASDFDFSMLFGIQDFYERFGYTRAWSDEEYIVTLNDLPKPATAKEILPFAFERRGDLEPLFNRYHARHTGAAVRPTYHTWNLRGKKLEAFLWKDQAGKVAGYVAIEDKGERLDVVEAVGGSETILRVIAFAARQFSANEARFLFLHHESPLARRLRRGNVKESLQHYRNGMALARLIHLPRTLEKLRPELSRRLKTAGLGDYRGRLHISDGTDKATLNLGDGQVHVTEGTRRTPHALKAGREMSQLILGTQDARETMDAYGMRLAGDARFLIPAMFPNQYPALSAADRF